MILVQSLLVCVIFLTLFGLALWPVLFKNSLHSKFIFLGSNIIFLIMLLYFGKYAGDARAEHDERREQFRDALAFAADALDKGIRPAEAFQPVPEDERDSRKVLEQTDRFAARLKMLRELPAAEKTEETKK